MEDNKAPEVPMPCSAGCGFYGSKIYNNMCSKCFKEHANQSKKGSDSKGSVLQGEIKVSPSVNPNPVVATTTTSAIATDTVAQGEPGDQHPTRPVQLNKGRCFVCKSKIPLTKQLTNKCRCEYIFCDTHRYPDEHQCDFDHASMDKDILAKKNPKLNERPRGGRSFQRLDSM